MTISPEKHINWGDLCGNKFRFAPHPNMLKPNGYQIKLNTKIRGETKSTSIPVVVTFDRNYVVQYFSKILSKLQPVSLEEWLNLAENIYDIWYASEEE